MFRFQKQEGKDFVVLNLTDVQLCECQWDKNDPNYDNAFDILDRTVRELVSCVKPDLITVTGDISSADQKKAYLPFGRYLDQFGIPWCLTWGNHDQQEGLDFCRDVVADYRENCSHFLHEDGDPALGNGNFIIEIGKGDKPVHALFMIDSHNCVYLPDENGDPKFAYDKLNEAQIDWYKEQTAQLIEKGCTHSSMLMHIPIYAYNEAWEAAFDGKLDPTSISLEQSYDEACWNEGYKDSFGVRYEGICSYPQEDGVFAAIKQAGITQNIIAGHDHVDNFVILYQGVNFIYGTKTGKGCYWNKDLNGGTVLSIDDAGETKVRHAYVDVSDLLKEYDR